MTDRLYYTDPFLREFEATVVDRVVVDGRQAVILDRTAFYPTSGGQPFDTGTLAGVPVVEVIDREDRTVLHFIEGLVSEGPVLGCIDWERRFDHMQQHTGQHVLSAAFDRVCQARTESFHLGTVSAPIDLARELSAADAAAAELAANQIVWEDRPVQVRFVDASAAADLPFRKNPVRTGVLRIVEVEGYDLSACGGTHVSRTGAIGSILVNSCERFRGGTRVEFLCGVRALHGFRAVRDSMAAAARLLSTRGADLPGAIERLLSETKDARRRLEDVQERLARLEAGVLASRGIAAGGAVIVLETLDGWDAGGLKSIASAIAERPGHAAVLATSTPPLSIVAARAADLTVDASAIVKSLTVRFGGRGGGRPELAQGGGLDASAQEVIAFARTLF